MWFPKSSSRPRANAAAVAASPPLQKLEGRLLLHGGVDDFHIDFAPAGVAVGAHYDADSGAVFGARAGGETYGWQRDNTSTARRRRAADAPDIRYNTVQMLRPGNDWEMALPDGDYTVHVVAGDPAATGAVHRVNVEGVTVVGSTATASTSWFEGAKVVTVRDGRLTISAGTGADGTRVAFVDVTPYEGGTDLSIRAKRMKKGAAQGAKFVVRREGPVSDRERYTYLIGGTAKNGRDYFRVGGVVTFRPGKSTATVSVKPKPSLAASPRTVMLTLRPGDGYDVTRDSATATIWGAAAAAPVAASGSPIRINFQPGAASVPAFYYADGGAAYGLRANGMTYGWSAGNTANTRDRNSINAPDQRYDTLNHMQKNGANMSWNIAVANGTYTVRIVAGDPDYIDGVFKTNVEGVLTVNGTPTSANRWVEGTKTVTVSDGKLTISNAAGASNNKISFAEIMPGSNPLPVVRLAASAAASEGGGAGAFTVTRTGSTAGALTVTYTVSGSASNGTDYNALSGAVTIPAGSTSAAITVTPKQDSAVEGPEIVSVKLSAASGYSLAQKYGANVTISDDDTPSTGQTLKWTNAAGGPTARAEAMGAVANGGKVYAFGGYVDSSYHPVKRVDEYNPATNTWTRKKDMPIALTHAGVTSDGTYVYLAGGYPGTGANGSQVFATTAVYRYDPANDSWTNLRGLPSGRGGGGLQLLGRTLYFYSGSDGARTDRNVVWSLNLDDPTPNWVERAPVPAARNHVGGAVVNGKLYVLGGQQLQDAQSQFKADMWMYDPSTNAWTTKASLIAPARSHIASATMVRSGRIIIAGGEGDPNRAQLNHVDSYDPATNQWTRLAGLPAARSSGIGVTMNDNRLFFTSGFNGTFKSESWIGTFS